MAGKAWWQRYEVTGDLPSAVRRQRDECWGSAHFCLFNQLNPWDSAAHSQWVFPLELDLSRNSLIDIP